MVIGFIQNHLILKINTINVQKTSLEKQLEPLSSQILFFFSYFPIILWKLFLVCFFYLVIEFFHYSLLSFSHYKTPPKVLLLPPLSLQYITRSLHRIILFRPSLLFFFPVFSTILKPVVSFFSNTHVKKDKILMFRH